MTQVQSGSSQADISFQTLIQTVLLKAYASLQWGQGQKHCFFSPLCTFLEQYHIFLSFFLLNSTKRMFLFFFPKVRFFCSCFIVMCHLLSAYEEMLSVILQAVFTSQLIYCRFISGSEARPGSPSGCGRARSSSCRPARVFVVFPPHG